MIVTGKGRSAVIAAAYAAAEIDAPAAPSSHHEGKCHCRRCVHIIGEVSRSLRALEWSYTQIGRVVQRGHDVVQYHCKPSMRARKNNQARAWYEAHPDYRPPSRPHKRRTPDQILWDNLRAQHDPR